MFGKPRKPKPFFKGTAPCEKYGVFLFYVWSQTGLTFLRQRKIVYSSPLQESSMSVTPPFPFRANTIPGLRYASLSLN